MSKEPIGATAANRELEVMQTIWDALNLVNSESKVRALRWAMELVLDGLKKEHEGLGERIKEIVQTDEGKAAWERLKQIK